VQNPFSKISLAATLIAALAAPMVAPAQDPAAQPQAGQAPAPAAAKKNWKDQAEYDLVASFTKEPDATKKLAILNSWKEKYPSTEFGQERLQYYLTTYQALQQPDKMIETAKEILAQNPKDLQANYWIAFLAPTRNDSSAEFLGLAEKAANGLLAAEKPASTDEAGWKKAKTDMDTLAQKSLGWAAMQRKENEKAEQAFRKSLELNPNAGEVSYWLGTVILAQRKPERQSEALYHFARAAAYDGPGALTPQGRQQIDAYLTKAYTSYHGQDAAGLAELKAKARAAALPPADFNIKSAAEIAVEKENEFRQSNPQLATWLAVKENLTGASGEDYFASSVKDSQFPKLKGKVISQKPATRPTLVVIGIENAETPEVTLKLENPLPGRAEPGQEIEFEGVPSAFSKSPFMLTIDVEPDKITGWPSAAPATKRPAGKKASKKG
jgi:tetratricopeptide (TPR) repeat protein